MTLVPMRVGEKLRIVQAETANPDQREQDRIAEEQFRIAGIARRRRYVDGEQYEAENLAKMAELRLDPLVDRLPEHERLHAYSTQIEESVNFIADQLGDSFEVVAVESAVQDVINNALQLSTQLSGSGDSQDVSIVETLLDALVAGDVAFELRWDPVEQSVFFDLWESEAVTVEWADRDTPAKVSVTEVLWIEDASGQEQQVVQTTEFTMDTRLTLGADGAPDRVWQECRKRVWWDDQDREREDPKVDAWTGFPFIPWALLRPRRKGIRGQRGQSIIKDQAIESADRYNANEQSAYLIARYNSAANLVVVGDAASLQLSTEGVLATDVADVLSFPGGTAVTAVQLPTDPEMINHQRTVLAEEIYNTFGLTRVEPDTIQGLGTVSGYALEILNRKTEGTFERIRKNVIRDMRVIFSKTLDLFDALIDEPTADPISGDVAVLLAVDEQPVPLWAIRLTDQSGSVDAGTGRFSNMDMEIRLGSGYIVDDVMIRDDFSVGMISRRAALRRRGYDDPEIDQIEKEIADERVASGTASGTETGRFSTQAGRTVGTATPPG